MKKNRRGNVPYKSSQELKLKQRLGLESLESIITTFYLPTVDIATEIIADFCELVLEKGQGLPREQQVFIKTKFVKRHLKRFNMEDWKFFKEVIFDHTELENAVFKGVKLQSGVWFKRSGLKDAAFQDVEFKDVVEFIDSDLIGDEFTNTNFLSKVLFKDVKLENTTFKNVEFREGVRFVKSNLTGANFVRTNFTPRASFEGSDLAGSTFDNVTFGFVDFRDSNLRNARFQKTTFAEVNPTKCRFIDMEEIDRESAVSLRDAVKMWYQHAMASARDYWERTLIQKEYRRALGEIESWLK